MKLVDRKKDKFQFTPLREGRRRLLDEQPGEKTFQFTPLREGRRAASVRLQRRHRISIHAPPRGATVGSAASDAGSDQFQFTPLREGRRSLLAAVEIRNRFQFTPLREGRRQSAAEIQVSVVFQFTPLREGRPERCLRSGYSKNFNSRPSARGDRSASPFASLPPISIHAPPRGATASGDPQKIQQAKISIHAPPRGATIRHEQFGGD